MPNVPEDSEEIAFEASAAEDDRYADLVLAGFRACAKEALRFLLEEEGLSPDHPLTAGLNEHLVRQQCHLAGTLHNDSGIDLEESFFISTTDGSTSASNYSECSTESAAKSVLETLLSLVSSATFNGDLNEEEMCSEIEEEMCCENEDDYRTAVLTKTLKNKSPHKDRYTYLTSDFLVEDDKRLASSTALHCLLQGCFGVSMTVLAFKKGDVLKHFY